MTLYQSRGNQINIYGYAAFGLTVVPYAIISLVNLFSALVTPEYPALFMVGSDIMDEAIRHGATFYGVVGRLVLDPQNTMPKATVLLRNKDKVHSTEFWYQHENGERRFAIMHPDYPTPVTAKDLKESTTRKNLVTNSNPFVFVPSCSKFQRVGYQQAMVPDITAVLPVDGHPPILISIQSNSTIIDLRI